MYVFDFNEMCHLNSLKWVIAALHYVNDVVIWL